MKKHIQKFEKRWWMQSSNSIIYAIREYSSVLIMIWAIFTTFFFIIEPKPLAKDIINTIGLTGAIIHTLTWLYVMPKLLPQKLSKNIHLFLYIILIIFFIGLSILLICF